MIKRFRLAWFCVGLLTATATHAQPVLTCLIGGEECPVAEVAHTKVMVRKGGEVIPAPPNAKWRLTGDPAENSAYLQWSPSYGIRRPSGPDWEFDPKHPLVSRVVIEHDLRRGYDSKPDDDPFARRWPTPLDQEAIVVAAWLRDGSFQAVKVEAVPTEKEHPGFLVTFNFPLSPEDARGQAVELLWSGGGFLKPVPIFSRPEDQAVLVAGMLDDAAALRRALAAGGVVDALDRRGAGPLYYAAEAGSVHVLGQLLGDRSRVRAQETRHGDTALHLAAALGRLEVVNQLLDAGARKNAQNRLNQTPIGLAAEDGHLDVVDRLERAHADPEMRDDRLHAAFDVAVDAGYADIAQLLLDHNVAHTFQGPQVVGALVTQTREGHVGMVRIFLEHGVDARETFEQVTALFVAARRGNRELADVLLKARSEVNAAGPNGVTPLMIAASTGNVPFATALLEAHADTTLRSRGGETALHFAALLGHVKMVNLLADHGASISGVDGRGFTPLEQSLISGQAEVADALIARGARLDYASPRRDAALVAVLRLDNASLLASELHQGLNPNAQIEGWPLRTIAQLYQAKACAAELERAGATDAPPGPALSRPSQLDQKMAIVADVPPDDVRPTDEDFPEQIVVVQGVVDPAGRFIFPRVISTPDPRLTNAAYVALARWKFTPPIAHGQPTAVRVTIPIAFPASEDRPLQTYDVDTLPQVVSQTPPEYPYQLRAEGKMGEVLVDFLVDKHGVPRRVHTESTVDTRFDKAAETAVARWRFKPGVWRGEARVVHLQVPIVFSLGQ